jgi:hypothetical protein
VLVWCTLLIALDRSFKVFRYPLENVFVTMTKDKVDSAREFLLGALHPPSVIILGSSHGQFGIDPEILCGDDARREDVYNFAFGGGMGTQAQLQFLQKLLERGAPERVIYGLDAFALNYKGDAALGRVRGMLNVNKVRELTVAGVTDVPVPEVVDGARFGSALASFGERVLVGAPANAASSAQDAGDGPGRGAAFLYQRAGTTWETSSQLSPAEAVGTRFGSCVAFDGRTAVVGSPGAPSEGGAVCVFQEVEEQWRERACLTGDGAGFGSSVAVSGGTLLVGVPGDDGGAVVTFVADGAGWRREPELRAADTVTGERFGAALALAGDRVVIGASHVDAAERNTGRAYVFTRESAGWRLEAHLEPEGLPRDAFFGTSVAISGDRVLIGARAGGKAFVFVRTTDGWAEEAALTAMEREVPVGPVALAGDVAWVAISRPGRPPRSVVGFRRSETWSRWGRYAPEGFGPADHFGRALAAGPGYVAIGAPFASPARVTLMEPDESTAGVLDELEDSLWERIPRFSRAFLYRAFVRRYLRELLEGEVALPARRPETKDLEMFAVFESYQVSALGHVRAQGEANVDYVRRSNVEFSPAYKSVSALERLIRITAEAGARLDLVHIPEHAACHENAQTYEDFAAFMADFVERTGVSYHDFNRPDEFPLERTELFLDTDHLNAEGATLFSELLGERLELRNAGD